MVKLAEFQTGVDMEKTDEFFEQSHPHVVAVLGTALMQLLVEERELSKGAMIEMIQVLYQDDDFDLAAELAIDVLSLPKEGGAGAAI